MSQREAILKYLQLTHDKQVIAYQTILSVDNEDKHRCLITGAMCHPGQKITQLEVLADIIPAKRSILPIWFTIQDEILVSTHKLACREHDDPTGP